MCVFPRSAGFTSAEDAGFVVPAADGAAGEVVSAAAGGRRSATGAGVLVAHADNSEISTTAKKTEKRWKFRIFSSNNPWNKWNKPNVVNYALLKCRLGPVNYIQLLLLDADRKNQAPSHRQLGG